MLLISILGLLAILTWMYIDTRKEFSSQHLQDTLKEMHKELLHLKDVRLSQKQPEREEVERMIPVLMHKLRIIDIGEWDNVIKSMAKQMKRPITKQSIKKGTWFFKVASVGSQIKKDLISSGESTRDDLAIIVEWLDSQSWGLKELRDKDKQWGRLYETIEPFTRDNKLRELIYNHISISYVSCNGLLIYNYSIKWPNSIPIAVLHQTWVGSPFSPIEMNKELSGILGGIDKRMSVLNRAKGSKRK
jgi:hypothetical protein